MRRPKAIERLLIEIRYSVRSILSVYPLVYLPIARHRYSQLNDRIVRPDTDLVIDGFERSGNWFAVAAFLRSQREPVGVVHHLHAPAQIEAAARFGVPTILLIRTPEDAVISQMIRTNGIRPRQALKAWIRYYERVTPFRDRVVVADFDRVTTDFGSVIDELNRKFGTQFNLFDATPENMEACFAWIDEVNKRRFGSLVETFVGRPSAVREGIKSEIRRQVRDPSLARVRAKASATYKRLTDGSSDLERSLQDSAPAGIFETWVRRPLGELGLRAILLSIVVGQRGHLRPHSRSRRHGG